MADNYLEKRYEEVFGSGAGRAKTSGKRCAKSQSLDSLILKNRSYRGFDANYVVSREELMQIVEVCTKVPSACNQQALRFRLVTAEEAAKVLSNIRLGGALPELHLPLKGEEPVAFIIVCATSEANRWVDVDLGIAAQTMLLKAVEIGLNGICIGAFNKSAIIEAFGLGLNPLMILAVGKGVEKIQLVPTSADASRNYYRKEGIHYVPKVRVEDLLL